MTTTLKPVGPERRTDDGVRARTYAVRVNSRTVGSADLGTDPRYGTTVGRINTLEIDEPDRRRGRGTVAALAAEEVLRCWGCARVEVSIPAEAGYALRMAEALAYTERNIHMTKPLDGPPRPLPDGVFLRPFSTAEYGPWREREGEGYVAELVGRGVPRQQAEANAAAAFAQALPDGPATEGSALVRLENGSGPLGHLWVRLTDPPFVFSVEVAADRRGLGHGRTLMLAAENLALEAGGDTIQLNVFAGNVPAQRLYASLGYRAAVRHFYKSLL
ncbi:GNAT family N-acetyltransferase [Streptomyces sp. NBC_01190]|uniref:GNAT family N-acetyltransferase n=1 Tax=Streptomyces sp. NBC_01190 TaxID=2903767 RepID=UPI00386FA145|nr:GNAT family N-acetyltransferase [Streptomyces sp. NBC_01190]